ncbi:MAG: hypothetical protein GY856_32410 [bacterium]|nr:hypothetical protein [bacterium]
MRPSVALFGIIALTAALLASVPPAGAQGPVEAIDVGGLEARSAALMLSGQDAGELAVTVASIPMPDPAAERVRVLLVVDVDGDSLLVGAAGEMLITELYAYALDTPGDALAATLTQAFMLELEPVRDALAERGIKFLGHLDLVPGEYSLRVLVLHRQADRFALRVVPLSVPSWEGAAGPVIMPPIFPEAAERWIVVTAAGETPVRWTELGQGSPSRSQDANAANGGERKTPERAFPMVIDDRSVVPATRPLVGGETRAELLLMGRGLPAELRAQLVATDGREPADLPLHNFRPLATAPTGLELAVAELDPGDQTAGSYRLQLLATGEDTPAGPAPSTPLTVLPREIASRVTVWTELDSATPDAGPGALMTGEEEEEALASDSANETLVHAAAAYREALVELAAENRSAARAAIIRIESDLLASDPRAHEPVIAAQLRAAIGAVGDQVESLVSLIWLHEELYRQYHRRQRYRLATHSRQMMLRLAAAYLARSDTREARQLVACALVSLAGYLQEIGARHEAQQAFERALGFDPTHEAALLALAVIHEAFGHYEMAADLLQRLRKVGPLDPEARLRLAINLRRLGSRRQALRLLRKCIEDPAPSWVTALAYQELANLRMEEQHDEEAAAILREAIARLPGNQRLYVQLAAVLDGLERPAEARAVVDQLDPLAGRDVDSPRLRYTRIPTREIVEARRMLAAGATSRLRGLTETPPTTAAGGS